MLLLLVHDGHQQIQTGITRAIKVYLVDWPAKMVLMLKKSYN